MSLIRRSGREGVGRRGVGRRRGEGAAIGRKGSRDWSHD